MNLVADPMNLWKHYHNAQTVPDALQVLADAPESACLIAGGTDLMLDLQQGNHAPVHTLVDVTAIPEMTALEIREGELFIGASVPHAKITHSSIVQDHATALAIACGLIGGPQVRNSATLGGNVGHALPAADGTIALVALDAQAEVASLDGHRRVPLETLFAGPGKSSLEARRELLVGFYLPLKAPNQASTFKRIMRPQGVAIAILNNAVWLERQGETVADVRISVGPSGPVPKRLRQAEDCLRGQKYSAAAVTECIRTLLVEANFRTSRHRATQEYRHHMAGILLEETLATAWQAALSEKGSQDD
jgi:xanthine dehydrogenase FAD-binding subunit